MTAPMTAGLDVAIIGGGQSGLAAGYHLARRGLRFAILDASPSAGHVWRARWDSLQLITPCPYNDLPGTPFPAPRWSFPHKDQVADYLDDYEQRHALAVRHGVEVTALRRAGEGFLLELAPPPASDGAETASARATPPSATLEARAVIIATGPFRVPSIPAFAARAELFQLHSQAYRNPAQVPAGEVLVVGCGNSGAGIAQDLAASHRVTLSLGRTSSAPRSILGRDLFWWAHRLGLPQLPATSWLGRRMQRGPDGLIGTSPAQLAARHRLDLAARLVDLDGDRATFADGTRRRFDAVIWATGFRPDYPFAAPLGAHAAAPLLDGQGRPLHRAGLTAVAGVCFLGLPWQRHLDSSLLGGVGRDAAFVATHLSRHLAGTARPLRAPHRTAALPLQDAP